MSKVQFVEIDPERDFNEIKEKYEEETGTTLYPAQDAMILIKLFAYYSSLLKAKFNDAANLNLVENSRAPVLDFLGAMKKCERLEDEDEESYIKRILLAPEGFSVAGPELAYKYFALSADSNILDVAVNCPNDDMTVNYNENKIVLSDNFNNAIVEFSDENFDILADYNNNEITLALKNNLQAGDILKVKIPHPYQIDLFTLNKDNSNDSEIKSKIEETLKPVRPISDFLTVKTAEKEEFNISGTVFVKKDSIIADVKKDVEDSLNAFLEELNNKLDTGASINKIESYITKFDDVVDISLTSPASNLVPLKGIAYSGSIGELIYKRSVDNG